MVMMESRPELSPWEIAARAFEPKPRRWAAPGDMAMELDNRMIQTPALRLVDKALVDLADGREKRLMVYAPPQEGKLLANDTPVPTPDGWVRHGDLRPGSVVFHPSGQQIKVSEVHPPALASLRVYFSDHTSVLVHPAHEWTVWDRSCKRWVTRETRRLASINLSHGPPGRRGHRYRFQLPFREPLDCPDADLPMDPYALGVWLGDGSTGKPAVTHHLDDHYEIGYPETARYVHPTTGIITTCYGGGMVQDLRDAGVWGNKHIPSPYLRASIRQRRALLAGLIDTDGHVSAIGQVSFDNANERLVRSAAELIRTLGYRAHVHRPTPPKLSSSGIQGKLAMWRVTFTPHDQGPARLHRKAAVKLGSRRRTAIVAIEEESPKIGRCITVDCEDGLYLVGEGMLPTHNSERCSRFFPLWMMTHDDSLRVAIVSFDSDTARRWGWQLRLDIETFDGENHEIDLGLRLYERPAAGFWRLRDRFGSCFTTGISGNLTGKPVDVLVLDDPIKDLEQANSITYRERAWRFWQAVAIPRMGNNTKVLLVQCVAAGMRVLNGSGRWAAVEDIRAGDSVVSLDRDGKTLVTAKVLNQRLSGNDETVTLKTDRLVLTVNGQHPVAVLRRSWFRPPATDIEWVPAADLKVGDMVVTAKSLPDDYVAADVLPDGSEVDEQRAWLLGYLLGDGWVTAHTRKRQQGNPTTYAVCCARSKSKRPEKAELDDRVLAALTAWSPNRVYETKFGYWRIDWNVGGRLLTEMGYGKGAHGKRVPEAVWSWSPPLRRAFLKGYAEADGHLQYEGKRATGPTWKLGSVSSDLLRDARDLALTCGVRPTTIYTQKPTWYHPPNSPKPVLCVLHRLSLTFMPDVPEGTAQIRDYAHPAPRHLRYERIRSVETGPVLPVYDLMVEGTETFVAEGFVTHNTRWHEDDLAGRILQHEGDKAKGGKWRVISIPAQCEDERTDLLGRREGEYMISARGRTVKDWEERRKDVGEYVWAALFQQRPAPAEGGIYKRLWWRYWSRAGEDMIHLGGRVMRLADCWRFATVDLAASERTSADYTVIAAWARTLAGDLVLLDRVRARIGEEKHFAHARGLVERWKLDTLFVEKSQHGFSLVREATQHGVPITPLTAETDKVTRALPASAWCSGGRVWLPAGAWWLDEFRDELAGFPASAHDDQADCLAYAVRAAITEWVPLVNRTEQAAVQRAAEPEPDPFGGQQVDDWDQQQF